MIGMGCGCRATTWHGRTSPFECSLFAGVACCPGEGGIRVLYIIGHFCFVFCCRPYWLRTRADPVAPTLGRVHSVPIEPSFTTLSPHPCTPYKRGEKQKLQAKGGELQGQYPLTKMTGLRDLPWDVTTS